MALAVIGGMPNSCRRVAFTVCQARISPVFDVARTVVVLEFVGRDIVKREVFDLGNRSPEAKLVGLRAAEVDELVCGAISKPALEDAINNHLSVCAFVAGELETVIAAWLDGRLVSAAFGMPGCGRPRRCRMRLGQAGRRCCQVDGEDDSQ